MEESEEHKKMLAFEEELAGLINKYSMESESDTPDYVLAAYLLTCLVNWNAMTELRDKWHGFKAWDDGITTVTTAASTKPLADDKLSKNAPSESAGGKQL